MSPARPSRGGGRSPLGARDVRSARKQATHIAVLGMAFAVASFAGMASALAFPLTIGSGNRAHVDARPGETVTVTGWVASSFDGSVFDAATTTEDGDLRPVGLLDLDGSGFRMIARDPATHAVKLLATGEDAPACRAAGLGEGPCFLDDTPRLAHERLLTVEELGRTLHGPSATLEVAAPVRVAPVVSRSLARRLAWLGLGLVMSAIALVSWRRARRERATLLGQIRRLAREAQARTRHDATFAPVRTEIDELVARAEVLERARAEAATRLSRLDRRLLEARRTAFRDAAGPASQGAARWISAELGEADRLTADHAAAIAGLEQIVSALRVIELSAREGRNLSHVDPVAGSLDKVARELLLREDALLEAERDVPSASSHA